MSFGIPVRNGLGIGLLASTSLATVPAFWPSSLFSAGEQGAWYDPSDFSTMFQDSAGTTPVTAAGDPVGLILDKSPNGNHASQATPSSRPVLGQDASGRYYLSFDGADDSLSTASVDFTATDEMNLFVGAQLTSASANGVVVELSTVSTTTNSTFALFASSASNVNTYVYRSFGTVSVTQASTKNNPAPPTPDVFTGQSDISGDSLVIRLDGAVTATNNSNQGLGNYGNYPLYIGSRAGSSLRFNGRLFSLIIRNKLSTTAQIEQTEGWVNARTGAY